MNILRYKQKAQGWMPRDDTGDGGTRTWSDSSGSVTTNPDTGGITWTGSNNGSFNEAQPTTPTDTTNFTPIDYQKQLSDMFDKSNPAFTQNLQDMKNAQPALSQWTTGLGSMYSQSPDQFTDSQNSDSGQALKMAGIYGVSNPGMLTRLGVGPIGQTAAQHFDQETPAQQADRMGLVGNGIGAIGQAAFNTAIPAFMRVGLAGANAYNTYNNTGDAMKAGGQFLGAMPGYFGSAGQALQGNYGAALTGAATKAGVDPNLAGLGGIGLDAYNGKNVTTPAYSLAGGFAGSKLGGPVGGVFGSQLGKSLASIFGKK